MTIRKFDKYTFFIVLLIISVLLFDACSSSNTQKPKSAEEMYNLAMKDFEDEDWEEANQLFEVIKLQYAASQYADDAQYHIAEINFNKGEFILAAYNYNSLRRTYPTSKYYKTSLYKAGLCYYKLSPPYDRDQEYTYKAIEIFQDYQHLYAGDSLSKIVSDYIDELRDKLGHRAFFTAQLYEKLHSRKSALIYYDVVIDEFPDTKYFEQAYYAKIRILSQTFRLDELHLLIEKYRSLFPKGKYLKEIAQIEKNNPK